MINGMRYGGMELQLVEIIHIIMDKGYTAYLGVLNKKGPMADALESYLAQPVHYLDRRKVRIPHTMFKWAKLIKTTKAELVYVQDSFSTFYAIPVSKLLRVKLINGSIRHAGVSHGFEYFWEKLLLQMSDAVVSNSKAGLEYYGVKGKVVYNLLDRERFRTSTAPLNKIVMNANFSDYKDHLTLLIAGRMLIREGIVTQIGLIGDGKHRLFYEKLCQRLGISEQVVFHGQVHNVEDLLLDYGIGILCSTKRYKEGISNSILEYMGSGLIAIGSNVGAVPEIIKDGYNGFLFEPEDHHSLYEKICRVISKEADLDSIRNNAYDTLDMQFNPQTNCAKLIEIFQSV